MLCKIADLIAEIPDAGGLAPRCRDYLWSGNTCADITVRAEHYRLDRYGPEISNETVAYMEAAYQFYLALPDFGGFYLHASAVVLDGRAYLFSGPCRAGKSTHARLWQQAFGAQARVINDDKPALRYIDGCWYAYGTPWCGKDGINLNERAPLAGVCFLKKAEENEIRQLSRKEALQKILAQTIHKFTDVEKLDKMLGLLDQFLRDIPVYELSNRPEQDAARLSYQTMRDGAKGAKR